ncbi:oxidoreductase domain-containing protein [Lineolata rhizophorae]|uniref:Oxidoreductase domain-containing protein n=1 Tax=Lineolata rhizophorae TaxID=578093 RepID=A0A6A6NZ12_9PEZI|nr:oxidoreductase domain-containing protein [Lineolata rhizophorae]
MTTSAELLPEGFLEGPAPNITMARIDFSKSVLPGYAGLYAAILDGVLSEEECKTLTEAAEAQANGNWERAMVNVGGGRQVMATDIRNCGRIIWDSPEMVAKLWARIEPLVPELQELKNREAITGIAGRTGGGDSKWLLSRLNERMRFLKYTRGEYFQAHRDGSYVTDDGSERSWFTLHLYLNDSTSDPNDPLEGGATRFHDLRYRNQLDVVPKIGRVLLFQHAHLIHSGADVVGGTKLTMRTDIMYRMG